MGQFQPSKQRMCPRGSGGDVENVAGAMVATSLSSSPPHNVLNATIRYLYSNSKNKTKRISLRK